MVTIMICGDIHALIVEKQQKMRNRYNVHIRISDIVAIIVENGIGNIERLLGFEKETGCIKKYKFEIINMANKIGVDIICVKENICDINPTTIPSGCGVYIITTESGRMYVGTSLDIYNRVVCHNIEESIRSISIYLTGNKSDANLLERYIICELNPEINTKKPMSFSLNKKMKTVQIEDNVYFSIVDKRREILKKYRTNVTIFQIVDALLKNYVDKIEKLFGFNSEEGENVLH